MSSRTMSYFKSLIVMENFFCVSRPNFIEDRKIRLICDAIFISISIVITSIIVIDLITVELNIGFRIFELIIGIELLTLAIGSRRRKALGAVIERLDDKCGVEEEFGLRIKAKSTQIVLLFPPSLIFDFIGLKLLDVDTGFSLFLCVAFAAHDAEMAFCSLLVETINMRIEQLKTALPNTGSRIYRHILIATAHLREQFTWKIILMLGVSLMTTVAYEFILTIADSENILYLFLYLTWRQSRSMYSLWMTCSAIARTGSACSELALHLAGRLTQNQSISKEQNPVQYKTLRRWYVIVESHRPQYISGSILSIGCGTPILVLDLSVNYMLIIVQGGKSSNDPPPPTEGRRGT